MIQPYDCIDEDDAFVGFGTEGITLYDSLSLLYFRSLERIFFLVEFFYDDVRSFFFSKFSIGLCHFFQTERENNVFHEHELKKVGVHPA